MARAKRGLLSHALRWAGRAMQEWKWVLLVAGFSAALVALHFISANLEARMRMQAFVASLGGASSEEYCPDYLPLVQAALTDYYWPEDGAADKGLDNEKDGGGGGDGGAGKHPRRATGAPLVAAEEARVTAFLEAAGAYRFSIRRRGGRLALKPSSSRKDRKRLADFKANVALAQQAFGPLPDLEGWVVWGDAPTLSRADYRLEGVRLPPVGYSTTTGHYDVSMPYVEQDAWNEEQDLARLAELVLAHPWETKVAKAIWRGSPTGNFVLNDETLWDLPRAKLVNASLVHPELIDARFTSCKQCSGRVKEMYAEAGFGYGRFFSFEEQFGYQALVDIDGNSWSSRFPQLLSINAAVFKQETPYREFFRPLLKPYVHYIPVSESLAELPRLLRDYLSPASATHHDRGAELREVAAEATRFYIRHLTPSKQLCYFHLLLKEMGRIHGQAEARAPAAHRRHG